MKKWIWGITTALILMTGTIGGCGWSGWSLVKAIINDKPDVFSRYLPVVKWCGNGLPFVSRLENILDKKYLILFGNNMELRPAGGFSGSYARIVFSKGGMRYPQVEDIYQPDGQLPGHVEPPYPIQEAFGQGWWKLRDANWDPDYASAASTLKWFFEHGGEKEVSGIISINLGLIEKLVDIYGPLKLNTFEEQISSKNFYPLAQKYAETRIDENNKTQKRSFLGAVGTVLVEKIKSGSPMQWLKTAKLIFGEMETGQVLLWMDEKDLQKEIEFRGWAGTLENNWQTGQDYLYVVETNLGANKANCCVERSVNLEKYKEGVMLTKIVWRNNNEFEHPKPPAFWGGNYINYVRVIIPREKEITKVEVDGKNLRMATAEDFGKPNSQRQGRSEDMYVVDQQGNFKTVGFWVINPAGKETTANVYTLRNVGERILMKRQPGIEGFDLRIVEDGKIETNTRVTQDTWFGL